MNIIAILEESERFNSAVSSLMRQLKFAERVWAGRIPQLWLAAFMWKAQTGQAINVLPRWVREIRQANPMVNFCIIKEFLHHQAQSSTYYSNYFDKK